MTPFAPPHPLLCGILNVTPDSFSDGGRFLDPVAAAEHGRRMVDEGAAIVDVGGESTRPGAEAVAADEQIRRVVPAIRALVDLRRTGDVPWAISIDTTSADVAETALAAGATIVNDVSGALDDPRMLEIASRRGAGIILMHRRVPPHRDRYSDCYEESPQRGDIVGHVAAFLDERVAAARRAGLRSDAIAIDPGFGFGKSVAENFEMLARLPEFTAVHPIVMVGASRKSFLGAACRVDAAAGAHGPVPPSAAVPADRLGASLAAAAVAALNGAAILRVHDVAATRQAVAVVRALLLDADGRMRRTPRRHGGIEEVPSA